MGSITEAIAAAEAQNNQQEPSKIEQAIAAASAAAEQQRMAHQSPPAPIGTPIRQFASGTNEGLAMMIGAPLSGANWIADKANDLFAGAVNKTFGTDLVMSEEYLQNPIAQKIRRNTPTIEGMTRLMQPFIGPGPVTDLDRIVRRAGQEVGAGVLPGGAIARGAAKPIAALGTNTISDVAAGLGGGIAAEVAPDSTTAQMIAAIASGGLAAGSIGAFAKQPKGPSIETLRTQQQAAYDAVDQSTARLTPQATEQISANIVTRMREEGMDPLMHPKATRMTGRIEEIAGETPTISRFENLRRVIGRDVAGAIEPAERRLGQAQIEEIDNYLSNIRASDVTGAGASDAIESLQEARNLTQRIKKSEILDDAMDRADRQASVSGTGGNSINTTRQRINAILNNPRKLRGFSAEERAAMRDIVAGTPTQNAARLLGRLSPTSGALPLMGGLGATASGVPGLQALPFIGFGAKVAGEALTNRAVDALSGQLRAGRQLPRTPNSTNAIIGALALQQGVQQ